MILRNGTYLGECLVDCNEEIVVTPEGVTYSLTSNAAGAQPTDIHAKAPLARPDWEALVAAVDHEALSSLPPVLGQPDAGDAGGEFLEISDGGHTRRVAFPLCAEIPETAPLLDALRDLRARMAKEHGR